MDTSRSSKCDWHFPSRARREGDTGRRTASQERISQLLSALDAGTWRQPDMVGTSAPPAKDEATNKNSAPGKAIRFRVVDRTGPIAEFESWEEASAYVVDPQCQGATIVRVEKEPGAPESD